MTGSVVSVTGATGFVGRHAVRELLSRGWSIRALVRDPEKARRHLPSSENRLEWVVGDALDAGAVRELAAGASAIVHTIGIRRELPPESTFARIHVAATRAVLAAAQEARVQRFVHISALGTRPDAPTAYHRSKYEAECLVRASGLQWTILRPSLIHGPDGELIQMIKNWTLSRSAPWFFLPYFARVEKTGSPPRPRLVSARVQPISVQDVAIAVAEALGSRQTIGEVYPLAGPETLDWPSLLRTVRDAMPITDTHKRILPIPSRLAWAKALVARAVGLAGALPFGPSEPLMAAEDSVCDLSKAQAHLHLAPRDFTGTVRSYAAQI